MIETICIIINLICFVLIKYKAKQRINKAIQQIDELIIRKEKESQKENYNKPSMLELIVKKALEQKII